MASAYTKVGFVPYRRIDVFVHSVYRNGAGPRRKRKLYARRPHYIPADQRDIPYAFRLLYRRARQEFQHVRKSPHTF